VLVSVEVEAPVRVCIVGVESAADARRLMDELRDGDAAMAAIRAGLGEVWEQLRDQAATP
jgi:hypothetical protein